MDILVTQNLFHKRFSAILYAVGILLLGACSNENDEPPPSVKSNKMKLVSYQQVEFNKYIEGASVPIDESQEQYYFGQRTAYNCPLEITFENDSLIITKPHNLIEKFRMTWDEDKLLLYNPTTKVWNVCGERNNNEETILNSGYYMLEHIGDNYNITIGQEYFLTAHTDIFKKDSNKKNTNLIWLKYQYFFK